MSEHRNEDNSDLKWFCEWVASQCDDLWEHGHAVTIDMYDNPAWGVRVELEGTSLEGVAFAPVLEGEFDEDGWMKCQLKGTVFSMRCNLLRLPDALRIFRTWVEAHQKV